MKNLTLFTLLALSAGTTQQAWAGSWQISTEYGVGSTSFNRLVPAELYTRNWVPGQTFSGQYAFSASGDTEYDYASHSINGTVKIVALWNPAIPSEPPPAQVVVKVSAFEKGGRYGGGTSQVTLENSLGGNTTQVDYSMWQHTTPLKLIPISTVGGTWTPAGKYRVEFPVQVNLNLTSVGPFEVHDDYLAGNLNAALDNRKVLLSRANAPAPFPEMVLNSNNELKPNCDLKKERDEWISADGTRYGHTRWSHKERTLPSANPVEMVAGVFGYPLYNDDDVIISQTIQANPSGNWSSNTTGSWTPSDPLDTKFLHSQDMPQGGTVDNPEGIARLWVQLPDGGLFVTNKDVIPSGWLNTPSTGTPNPVIFEHTYIDNADGAQAKSKYVLNLHDEWEGPIDDDRFFPIDDPDNKGVSYEEYYFVPTGAAAFTRQSGGEWSIGQNTTYTVTLSSSFQAGFKIQDWANTSGSIETKREQTVNTQISVTAPPRSGAQYNEFDDADIRFLSVAVYQAKRVHKLLKRFDTAGFVPHIETGTDPSIPLSDEKWGRTPQSKVEDLSHPRADWYIYRVGQTVPPVLSSGVWTRSGSAS